jgi:hypothetical protein
MGETNIYGTARAVTVVPFVGASATFNWGFRTKIDAAESGELNHMDASTSIIPVIYGLNSPTPARYKKTEATYSVNSYGSGIPDPTKWKKASAAKLRAAKSSAKTKAVTVPFKGALYTWLMNIATYTKIDAAGRGALGIADAVNSLAAAKNQMWGGNGKTSKPPSATAKITGNTVTTFYDESKTLAAPWSPGGGGGFTP